MTSRTPARALAAVAAGALLVGPLAGAAQAAPRKPPAPTITAKPATPTNARSATFEFTHPTAGIAFECSLNGGAYAACASPRAYDGPLNEGAQQFKVRARDAAGNASNAATATWTIDLTAPAAPTLTGVPTPSPTGATTASLGFTGAEAGVTFVCALDGAAPAACTSPVALTALADGPHTFTVSARDAAGNVGAPATGSWTVDTTPPPAPTITTGPANITNATTATFEVFNPETTATLECSLDGAAFTACPSPITYSGLPEGARTFDVRAADSLGNTAAAPRYAWTVDLTAPAPPTIVSGPSAQTRDAASPFTFDGHDAAVLRCSIDGGAYDTCVSPYTTPVLADGPHTLHVLGVDAASNESGATPYAWSVDNTPPPAPVVTGPPALTNSSSATFGITDSEPLVTFTCALDGGEASACETGATYAAVGHGAHTLVVTAADALGNTSSTPYSWTVDAVAPEATVTSPGTVDGAVTVSFSEPVSGVSTSSLVLRLAGTDTPLATTLLCTGAGGAVVPCTGPVTGAILRPAAMLVPGERYAVVANPGSAATIADAATNPLATLTAQFRGATTLQETAPAAKYTWRVVSTSAAYGSSYRTEHLAGAAATYSFSGTSIVWYTLTAKSQGLADVYVDGVKKATVNNYSATTKYRVARSISGLSAGPHVLRIVVRGVRGSTSGTGTAVAVDAFKVPGKTVTASPIIGQAWRVSPAAAAAGGAQAVADLKGQETSLRFRGTGISWYTSTGRNRGIVKVYVDNVLKATIDNYATTTTYNVRRSITGLSDARHTVRIVVTGTRRAAATGTYATLDRWVVA